MITQSTTLVIRDGGKVTLNASEYLKRYHFLHAIMKKLTSKEICRRLKLAFTNDYNGALETIAREKQVFIDNGLIRYWKGAKHTVTRDEIKLIPLVIEIEGAYIFNRSAVSDLAWMFKRNEGLGNKVAWSHAWHEARMQMLTYNNPEMTSHRERALAKLKGLEMQSRDRRKLGMVATQSSYHAHKQAHLKHVRDFNSLIANDDINAPRSLTKHWVTNIGNTFDHGKYGECEITKHVEKGDEWFAKFKCLDTGKGYSVKLIQLKYQILCGHWVIIKPKNPLCSTPIGEEPLEDFKYFF